MSESPTIVWFRQDLRLDDNPALLTAVDRGEPILPLYVYGPEEEGEWAPGGASRVWLHLSLGALDESLRKAGSRLLLRRGEALQALRDIISETGAGAVYWNRRYEPAAIERDKNAKSALRDDGVKAESFNASLLWEPWTIETKQGDPYKVFTPFWKRCQDADEPAAPRSAPDKLRAPGSWPDSLSLEDLDLEPDVAWDKGIRKAWTPGEVGARERLDTFIDDGLAAYGKMRNRPDVQGSSRLSPHLHHGEISPRRVWHKVSEAHPDGRTTEGKSAWSYLREIAWREFAYHLLYHFPETPLEPLRPEFDAFPWNDDEKSLERWQQGKTGFPVVDAGMRELWETGWMHNRVRMIVASFLVKDLMIPWQEGAHWFWDTLVDADLANNTLGWQWTAGCGADAAPYFRVFNPISQGEKFDPKGDYVRRWVPEVADRPDDDLHQPTEDALVDHAKARKRALAAYDEIKR